MAVHTTKEVVDSFGGTVPIGPVNTAADIFVDPHVAARGMLVQVDQAGSDVPVTVAGEPIKFTAAPSRVNERAPLLGERRIDDIIAEWSTGSTE